MTAAVVAAVVIPEANAPPTTGTALAALAAAVMPDDPTARTAFATDTVVADPAAAPAPPITLAVPIVAILPPPIAVALIAFFPESLVGVFHPKPQNFSRHPSKHYYS